ncbi:hypothetical protein [Nocardioides sp. YIM 152588]|uniref:hypothetical protein n=1 Tax=Nocardioides sp. YIM 152588 TaxID=3158259 RepID=UPI0032E3FAFC
MAQQPQRRKWDFSRPFAARSMWLLFAGLVIASTVLVGSLYTEFDLDPPHTEAGLHAAIWALLVGIWATSTIGFLALARFAPEKRTDGQFTALQESLWRECHAMAQYALERGRTPPADDLEILRAVRDKVSVAGRVRESLTADEFRRLVESHKKLAADVAPAMPKTLAILYFGPSGPRVGAMDEVSPDWLSQLGQVRLVRTLLGLAIILLPLFIALALAVGTRLEFRDGLFAGDVISRAQTACYLVVASALGATFASLHKARRYIENLSYDDQYESSYWVRFVQGLLAGLILAVLFSPTVDSMNTSAQTSTTVFRLGVPLLALVGGFSSDLVYRLLRRVIDAIETLFQGTRSDAAAAEVERAEARLRMQHEDAERERKAAVAARSHEELVALLRLAEQMPTDAASADARATIARRIAELLGTAEPEDDATGGAGGGGATQAGAGPAPAPPDQPRPPGA